MKGDSRRMSFLARVVVGWGIVLCLLGMGGLAFGDTGGGRKAGLDGTWYELVLDCPFCLRFEEHTISLEDKATVLEFSDRLEVATAEGAAGLFSREGQEWSFQRAVLTRHRQEEDLVVLLYPFHEGERASDVYARVWVLTPMADGKVLFGPRYEVSVFSEDAFERVEGGFRARVSFLPQAKIVANLDDVRVFSLNEKRRMYQPSPQVRFSLDGVACFIRESTSDADIARAYQEARRKAAQRENRLSLFRTLVRQGDEAYHAADYEDALNRYKAASAIMPEMAIVHADLGAVYQVQNRLMEAEGAYRLAIELEPGDADTRFNLAQVLEQQGRLEEALAMYRSVIELRPDDAEANECVVRLRRKLGAQQ